MAPLASASKQKYPSALHANALIMSDTVGSLTYTANNV